MATDYSPAYYDPEFNLIRHLALTRIDFDPSDMSLLITDIDDAQDQNNDNKLFGESTNYSPNFSDFSAPVSQTNIEDNTDMTLNPEERPILQGESKIVKNTVLADDNGSTQNDTSDDNISKLVPQSVISYYDESSYGIPRLMQFPLNSKKDIHRAIRSIDHVKNKKDRNTLIESIIVHKPDYNVSSFVSMNESTKIYGFEVPFEKRTTQDIVKEHLSINSTFYNHLFYSSDFAKSVINMKTFKFFDYFFPNFENYNFYTRLSSSLGGLGFCDELYQSMKLRMPIVTDYNTQLGFYNQNQEMNKDLQLIIDLNYDKNSNWFKCDLSRDYVHIFYCIVLYNILGEIMNDPFFDNNKLSLGQLNILSDFWYPMVCYHYDLYKEADPYSTEAIKQAQYLHDLFWNFNDNPYNNGDCLASMLSMIDNMACNTDNINILNKINESDIVSKEECNAYFVHELNLPDSAYLLPGTYQFPIINKDSIRLAMDMIGNVDKTDIKTFTKNLNKKYDEFGCTYSINIDHPYAKYASKSIINNMSHIIHESNTMIDDQGTSAVDDHSNPWYLITNTGKDTFDVLPSKELGPNTKTLEKPEITRDTLYF